MEKSKKLKDYNINEKNDILYAKVSRACAIRDVKFTFENGS
jgi:hypothetical protein